MAKTVFLEPLWRLRGEYQDLIRYPPEGYHIVARDTWVERGAQRLSQFWLSYQVLFVLYRLAPMQLVKPYLEWFKRPPRGTDLTYAVLHPVFRREPWILDMCGEQPHLLVGSEAMFRGFRGPLVRTLTSPFCKGIVCQVEVGKRALLRALGAPELERKIHVIPAAVPPRPLHKVHGSDGRIRLLFVGSANIDSDWQFRDKGGLVLLEAFRALRRRFPKLELTIRSRVSADVRAKYQDVPGIRIIEDILPWERLEDLFRSADIFVCPAHLTPSITFLHAMSYGLPIVTTDIWSNPELVEDGRTGLLVHHPEAHRYIADSIVHHDWPAFKEVVNRVHPDLVAGIVEKTGILIEDAEMRRTMGEEGRQEVERGKFSLSRRNESLKRFFDEAVSEAEAKSGNILSSLTRPKEITTPLQATAQGADDRSAGQLRVNFEPSGRLHPSHRYLLDYPPAGYVFTTGDGAWDQFVGKISSLEILYYNIWRLTHLLPVNLIKAQVEGVVKKPPRGTCMTFAINHLVYRDEPWVVLIEWVNMLTGFWMPEFRKHKREIEQALSSERCKRILTWCEPARNSILYNLGGAFMDKIEILPLAVPPRSFTKLYNDERVKLLFVGSANAPSGKLAQAFALGDVYDFHIKGGREVLGTFARLRRDYSNLELVMRARVPRDVRQQYEGIPGLTIIEEQVSWQRLEEEFLSADIYIFPCHQVTPWGSILEAMSYELPVVTTNVFANSELVEDGKTGFLVKGSEKVPYYDNHEQFIPSMVTSKREEFLRALRQTHEQLIEELVEKTKALIEEKSLRRTMGRAARWEVEYGRHSLTRRNAKLKTLFDEVVGR